MMRCIALALLVSISLPALAQQRQPAQITTLPSTSPQEFDLLDKTGAWVPFGRTFNQQFFPPSGIGFGAAVYADTVARHDGSDDAPRLQPLMNQICAGGGGTLVFGPHVYSLGSTLTMCQGLKLIGPSTANEPGPSNLPIGGPTGLDGPISKLVLLSGVNADVIAVPPRSMVQATNGSVTLTASVAMTVSGSASVGATTIPVVSTTGLVNGWTIVGPSIQNQATVTSFTPTSVTISKPVVGNLVANEVVNAGSTAVVGSGTTFTQLRNGGGLVTNGFNYAIISITDDTHLNVLEIVPPLGAGSGLSYSADTNVVASYGVTSSRIENLIIDGNRTGNTKGDCINFVGLPVANVNLGQDNISFVENDVLQNCAGNGVSVWPGHRGIRVEHTAIFGNGGDGIYTGSSDSTAAFNIIGANGGAGYHCDGCTSWKVFGGDTYKNYNNILLTSSNYFYNNGQPNTGGFPFSYPLAPQLDTFVGVEADQATGAIIQIGNPTVFTASITGSVLTVTGTPSRPIIPGMYVFYTGNPNPPVNIVSFGTGTGGAGTYNLLSAPGDVSSEIMQGSLSATVGVAFTGLLINGGASSGGAVCWNASAPSSSQNCSNVEDWSVIAVGDPGVGFSNTQFLNGVNGYSPTSYYDYNIHFPQHAVQWTGNQSNELTIQGLAHFAITNLPGNLRQIGPDQVAYVDGAGALGGYFGQAYHLSNDNEGIWSNLTYDGSAYHYGQNGYAWLDKFNGANRVIFSAPLNSSGPNAAATMTPVLTLTSSGGLTAVGPLATNASLAVNGGGVTAVGPIITNAYLAVTISVASGGSVVIGDQQDAALISAASPLTDLAVKLPTCSAAFDGKVVTVSTVQPIGTLTLTATAGTIKNIPTSMTAGGAFHYRCYGPSAIWFVS
jgi:hypothetical protein